MKRSLVNCRDIAAALAILFSIYAAAAIALHSWTGLAIVAVLGFLAAASRAKSRPSSQHKRHVVRFLHEQVIVFDPKPDARATCPDCGFASDAPQGLDCMNAGHPAAVR